MTGPAHLPCAVPTAFHLALVVDRGRLRVHRRFLCQVAQDQAVEAMAVQRKDFSTKRKGLCLKLAWIVRMPFVFAFSGTATTAWKKSLSLRMRC